METVPPEPPKTHDVWFASSKGGLVRIDETGSMVEMWNAKGRTGDLGIGPEGSVWATVGATVQRFEVDAAESFPDAPWRVAHLGVGEDKRLWALGFNQAAFFVDGAWTALEASKLEALGLGHLADVFVDLDGTGWIIGRDGVAQGTGADDLRRVDPPPAENFRPSGLIRGADGGLVLVHFDGLHRRTGEAWEAIDLHGSASSTRSPAIQAAAFAENGHFVYSDFSTRCVTVRDDDYRLVTNRHQLEQKTPAKRIRAVALDAKDRAWTGTDAGLLVDRRDFWPSERLPATHGAVTHLVARGNGPTAMPQIGAAATGTIEGTLTVGGKPGSGLAFEVCKNPARSMGSLGSPCETEDPSRSGVADASGHFVVRGLPADRYEIAVNVGGAGWTVVSPEGCCLELPANLGRVNVSRGTRVRGISKQERDDLEAAEREAADEG